MKTKQFNYFIGCFILICLLAGCGSNKKNLLLNPDLEEGKELPDKWETWNHIRDLSGYGLEEGNDKDGKKYAFIYSPKENDARLIQTISVVKGAFYKVSGWIRTKDVGSTGKGANICLQNVVLGSKGYYGTNDTWQYEEFYLKVEGDYNTITLCLSLGGYGGMSSGYAYFDNVQVQREDAPPPDVQVQKLGVAAAVSSDASSFKNALQPFQKLLGGYRSGDFAMLGAMLFSVVLALVILFLKRSPDKRTRQVEEPVKQPESPAQTPHPENPANTENEKGPE